MADSTTGELVVPKRHPGGRPQWRPLDLKAVEQYAAKGLSLEEIAACLGIHVATLYRRKKEFSEALKKGRAEGIAIVNNALWEMAVKEHDVTAAIFWLKVYGGRRDGSTVHVDVNMDQGGAMTTLQIEAEREEQRKLIRLMTRDEKEQYLELMERLAERQRRLRRGEVIEVEATPMPEDARVRPRK